MVWSRTTAGRAHFNGGQTHQTSYTLDGFNISDPVTGRLETRVNIETIQSMEVAKQPLLRRKRPGLRRGARSQNQDGRRPLALRRAPISCPGVSTDGGLHVNKWTPRLEFSGPLAKGRAWFHNGFDAFYSNDLVHGLPTGQNRTSGLTTSDLTRFQVNLTPGNILTASFLYNLADTRRLGLSFVNPIESTTNRRQATYMSSLRDQVYFGGGALLDLGFADTRSNLRDAPLGDQLFEITPLGNRGNYFVNLDRHYYRQQGVANLFLPTLHALGSHRLKFGIDMEREAYHQEVQRHDYEVLRADNSVARYVTFAGSPFQERKNLEAAQYIQDSWTPRDGLVFEAGIRTEWNEIVRDLGVAPRIAAAWSPKRLPNTKFSAGWGVYHDAIRLELLTRHQDQMNLSTFYAPDGPVRGPVPTVFLVNEQNLRTPFSRTASFSIEQKLPKEFYLKSGYMRRTGSRGLTFTPLAAAGGRFVRFGRGLPAH